MTREEPMDALIELRAHMPAPSGPALAPDRRTRIREHLMSEINPPETQPEIHTPETPVPVRTRRPHLRFAFVATAVMAAVAVTAVAVHPRHHVPATFAASPAAVAFLDDASAAVVSAPTPRSIQSTYVVTKGVYAQFTAGKPYRLSGLTAVRYAIHVDGSIAAIGSRSDHNRLPGSVGPFVEGDKINDVTPSRSVPWPALPGYNILAGLPLDPHKLLALIYAKNKGMGSTPDAEAFFSIGHIEGTSVMPPGLASALFQATKLIPGVHLVGATTDVLGRPAVALGQDEPGNKQRTEWLFDPKTHAFVGEVEFQVGDDASKGIKDGDILSSSAIVSRGFVEKKIPPHTKTA